MSEEQKPVGGWVSNADGTNVNAIRKRNLRNEANWRKGPDIYADHTSAQRRRIGNASNNFNHVYLKMIEQAVQ